MRALLFTEKRILMGKPNWGLSPRDHIIEQKLEGLYIETKPFFHPFDVDFLELLNQVENSRVDSKSIESIEESGTPLLKGCIDFMPLLLDFLN